MEHLAHQRAVRREVALRERDRQLHQVRDARRIRAFNARQVGRQVGDDHVDRAAADGRLQLGQHTGLAKIALDEVDALDGLERQDVHRDDGAVERPRCRAAHAHVLRGEPAAHVLAPGAGHRAQVDHHLPGLDEVQFLVDLLQLRTFRLVLGDRLAHMLGDGFEVPLVKRRRDGVQFRHRTQLREPGRDL